MAVPVRQPSPCSVLFPSTRACVLVSGAYICRACGWSVSAHSGTPLAVDREPR